MKKKPDPKQSAVATAHLTNPAMAPQIEVSTIGQEICHFRCRSAEFFVGDNGAMSMTRLLCFLSFFPASFVVVNTSSADTLGWYLSAYVLGYVGGKVTDVFMKDRPASEAPKVTINQPEKVSVNRN